MKKIEIFLIECLELEGDRREIVLFGVNQFITMSISFVSMIVISLIMGDLERGIILLGLFIPLRRVAGGYHAKTKTKCFIISNILFSFFLAASISLATFHTAMIIVSILLALLVYLLAPVDSENKRLSDMKKRKMKTNTFKILVTETFFILIIAIYLFHHVISLMFFSLLMVFTLQIVAVIKEKLITEENVKI